MQVRTRLSDLGRYYQTPLEALLSACIVSTTKCYNIYSPPTSVPLPGPVAYYPSATCKSKMAADIPQFKLNNGVLMPSVGMGMFCVLMSTLSVLIKTNTACDRMLDGLPRGRPARIRRDPQSPSSRMYVHCPNPSKRRHPAHLCLGPDRHFDTADAYRSEEALGRAIRDSGVPRKDVFVTTKL